MAKKQWTDEERKAFGDKMKAARQNKNPQTNTPTQNVSPQIPAESAVTAPTQLITLTQDQFDSLISRLNSGNIQDKAPSPALSPAVGSLQTNALGQVVGTFKKYNIDPDFYPDPVEKLLDFCDSDNRMRRHNVRDNYFIEWSITSKPYETKDHINIQEPTFHLTLYANEYDDQGEDTGRFIVIQTLHMNEDEGIALLFAAEEGYEADSFDLAALMDLTRYERARRWLVDIFYPPRTFDLNTDAREEAIGGSVVKVITKSNVKGFGNKTPTISDEELE